MTFTTDWRSNDCRRQDPEPRMNRPCNCAAVHALTVIRRILAEMPPDAADADLLNAAKTRLGSYKAVAEAMGVSRSVVSQWKTAGKVPKDRRGELAAIGGGS